MIDLKGIYRKTQLALESCTSMLSEGKHWPEDYKKTAINTIGQAGIPPATLKIRKEMFL